MTGGGKALILVVEDDRSTRESLVRFLEDEGYRAVGAANGRQALDLLAKIEPPSLILLDLMMPVMDGWQFLAERSGASRESGAPPIVLLSGMSFIRDAPGVADFISKPIRLDELRRCVERFCGSPVGSDPSPRAGEAESGTDR